MSRLIYILWHFQIKRHINYSILYIQHKYIQYKYIQYKYRNLIQIRFSKEFISEAAEKQQETVLFPVELPEYFSHVNCKFNKELFERHMDAGFLPCHSALDLNALKNVLNNLHLTIKFTLEPAKFDNFGKTSVINFYTLQFYYMKMVTYKQMYFTRKRTSTIISIITVIIRTIWNIIFPSIWQNVF